jgi:hypothetical protein
LDSKPFLSSLLTTIRQLQAARGADSVDVAFLGNAVRKEGLSWEAHGFERLSSALAQLQEGKLVETFRSEKGALRVRATSSSSEQSATERPRETASLASSERERFRPLRPPVWFAFAAALPAGQRRLLNRRNGLIWADPGPPPGPELDWVAVVPVGEDEQRRWAERFLERSDIAHKNESLVDAIRGGDWFRRFPIELEKHGPLLVRAWSHLRSNGIIDHVRAWARQNNISEDVLFGAERAGINRPANIRNTAKGAGDLRDALLSAIGRMGTEDLLALPIPARLVIEIVRPDLLR